MYLILSIQIHTYLNNTPVELVILSYLLNEILAGAETFVYGKEVHVNHT